MIEIEIDGQKLTVPEGTSIIEAADEAGIHIPRFCYHKKLSVVANCRMCLVEVDKASKPLPACATPVTPQMIVRTKSQKAMDAQRSVMEFLLINHPLDCPICDQGGECELQDLAMGYGAADSDYDQKKRAVFSEDIGPLIDTEMTRCIHCTRCVRFGEEIAGLPELGVVKRGEHTEIGTYVKHMMASELSGNVIDLCPVGALTAKPSRYSVRGWEATEHASIAPHDCVGTNIYVHTKGREYSHERLIMRVVPRENDAINETWMSDRDRFSYEGLKHADRCLNPMMKKNDTWHEVSWDEVLRHIAERTQGVIDDQGAYQLAALASPNSTTEELYLLQSWVRALGSNNVDFRLRERDFSDQDSAPAFPSQGMPTADIENLDVIMLVGSNVRFEQPLLSHRVYKATANGGKVFSINPVDYAFNFPCEEKMVTADLINALAKILKLLMQEKSEPMKVLASIRSSKAAEAIAKTLQSANKIGIFLGSFAHNHPNAAYIRQLVAKIAELTGANIGVFTEGANAAGAYLAGAVPHRGPAGQSLEGARGITAREAFVDKPLRAYFFLGFEPEYDTLFPGSAMQALRAADLAVCMSSYVTERMKTYADVILPITPFTENEGTFVNAAGTWQSFEAACTPTGNAQPAWKIIRAIARAMKLEGLDYQSVTDIRDELKDKVDSITSSAAQPAALSALPLPAGELLRMGAYSTYCVDSVVRRSPSLQETRKNNIASIGLNPKNAVALGFKSGDQVTAIQGGTRITLPVMINQRLAEGIVSIPMGLTETAGFGEVMAPVELEREVS
jgi:NADH-quinone oxidoreductase subunit G